jgi:hypothetical protein
LGCGGEGVYFDVAFFGGAVSKRLGKERMDRMDVTELAHKMLTSS